MQVVNHHLRSSSLQFIIAQFKDCSEKKSWHYSTYHEIQDLKKTLIFFTADCTWDFFSCTNNFGTWPENKECCEKRFDRCCEKVNDGKIKESRPTSTSKIPSDSGEGLQLSKKYALHVAYKCLNFAPLRS